MYSPLLILYELRYNFGARRFGRLLRNPEPAQKKMRYKMISGFIIYRIYPYLISYFTLPSLLLFLLYPLTGFTLFLQVSPRIIC